MDTKSLSRSSAGAILTDRGAFPSALPSTPSLPFLTKLDTFLQQGSPAQGPPLLPLITQPVTLSTLCLPVKGKNSELPKGLLPDWGPPE